MSAKQFMASIDFRPRSGYIYKKILAQIKFKKYDKTSNVCLSIFFFFVANSVASLIDRYSLALVNVIVFKCPENGQYTEYYLDASKLSDSR